MHEGRKCWELTVYISFADGVFVTTWPRAIMKLI